MLSFKSHIYFYINVKWSYWNKLHNDNNNYKVKDYRLRIFF